MNPCKHLLGHSKCTASGKLSIWQYASKQTKKGEGRGVNTAVEVACILHMPTVSYENKWAVNINYFVKTFCVIFDIKLHNSFKSIVCPGKVCPLL